MIASKCSVIVRFDDKVIAKEGFDSDAEVGKENAKQPS